MSLLRSLPQRHISSQPLRIWRASLVCSQCRFSSTTTAPSPLLSRLRDDLKAAMRARDAPRLAVLRGVLADITNSSKTSTPIKDDLGLLSLIRKRMNASKCAIEEFVQADRKDLVVKEEEQLQVLEQYAATVKTMDEKDVRKAVEDVVEQIRSDGRQITLGDAMKRTIGPGGALEGRMVEKPVVARIVKEVVATKNSV